LFIVYLFSTQIYQFLGYGLAASSLFALLLGWIFFATFSAGTIWMIRFIKLGFS